MPIKPHAKSAAQQENIELEYFHKGQPAFIPRQHTHVHVHVHCNTCACTITILYVYMYMYLYMHTQVILPPIPNLHVKGNNNHNLLIMTRNVDKIGHIHVYQCLYNCTCVPCTLYKHSIYTHVPKHYGHTRTCTVYM